MARRTVEVTIDAEGRDHGKVFVLTEMDAASAEDWAIRFASGLGQANVELPPGMHEASLATIAGLGWKFLSMVPYQERKQLMDDLMGCVRIIPDPNNRMVVRDLFPGDIEEVMTRLRLKMEVFTLLTGFSIPAAALERIKLYLKVAGIWWNTLMSQEQSGPSSPPGSPPS